MKQKSTNTVSDQMNCQMVKAQIVNNQAAYKTIERVHVQQHVCLLTVYVKMLRIKIREKPLERPSRLTSYDRISLLAFLSTHARR